GSTPAPDAAPGFPRGAARGKAAREEPAPGGGAPPPARKVGALGEPHRPRGRRPDRLPRRGDQVDARVPRPRLPVEGAARTEVLAQRRLEREDEGPVPDPRRRRRRPDRGDLLPVALN